MKFNKIKINSLNLIFLGLLSLMMVIASCNDDDEVSVEAVTLSFPADTISFDEDGGLDKTAIVLSSPSNGQGSFTVQLSGATYGTDYTTRPDGSSGSVTIDVEEGTAFRSFSLNPADNGELDGDKFVTLTLTDPQGAVALGTQTSMVIRIDDDEAPAPAEFEETDLVLAETADELTVNIPLGFAALADGTIDVELTGASYGTDYTTVPAAADGKLTLSLTRGAENASFTVKPIDNELVNGNDRQIIATLSNATGGIVVGDDNVLEITLADDESPTPVNFKEVTQSVAEDGEAITVDIELAMATEADGSFTVNLEGGTYGTDYTTNPEGSSGSFTIEVAKGATEASFTFIPVDNDVVSSSDNVINLTLSNATGGLELGTRSAATITIVENDLPVAISFASATASVREDGGAAQIVVNLASPAEGDGTFEVAINSSGTYGTDYTTSPDGATGTFTVDVEKGDTQATFAYIPTDNDVVNTTELITRFTLQNTSDAFTEGDIIAQTITLLDEEVPVSINFAETVGTVIENGEAVTVTLELATESLIDGSITIDFTGATYGTEFTTTPDGSSGSLTVDIPAGSTSATFTVDPVNNDIAADSRVIDFTLGNGTGGITAGTGQTSFELTITDKDRAITAISDVRSLSGVVSDGVVIRGVVTSAADANASQTLALQDATGGIVVNFNEAHSFSRGDELEIDLAGATIASVNTLVQVTGDLPLINALVSATGQLPAPEVITLTQALSGNFESQYVSVENVFFLEADGTTTLNGENTVSDGTDQLTTSVAVAPFRTDVIPFGTGTVSGILDSFNGTVRLLPQEASEVFANDPTVVLTVSQMVADFGSVNTDEVSAFQTFTVETANLLEDVTVDAPANFEVSLSEGSGYVNDLVIDQTVSGTTTVYVRFAPTSGVEGAKTGDLIVSTLQASTTTFSVSGTEAAAGPANLLLIENFDYGTTEGAFVNGGAGIGTDRWEAHSGAGNNPHSYVNTSLSLTGYPSSGVGGSLETSTTEDINIDFTTVNSGKVYASALVNISPSATVDSNGDYFMHFRTGSFGFYTRVTIKDDGAGNLLFGVRENGGDRVFSATNFAYNTTYMLVLVYDFSTGTSQIHVLDNVPATEPSPLAESALDANNATELGELAIRGSSNNPTIKIDGIRIGLDWESITGM